MNKSFIKWIILAVGVVCLAIQGIMTNTGSEAMVFGVVGVVLLIVTFVLYRKESDDKARAEGRPTHAEMKREKQQLKHEAKMMKIEEKSAKDSAKAAKGGGKLKKILSMASEAGESMRPHMTDPNN